MALFYHDGLVNNEPRTMMKSPRVETRVCHGKPAKARLQYVVTSGWVVRFNAAFVPAGEFIHRGFTPLHRHWR